MKGLTITNALISIDTRFATSSSPWTLGNCQSLHSLSVTTGLGKYQILRVFIPCGNVSRALGTFYLWKYRNKNADSSFLGNRALMVDWKTLQNLETLVLDLRGYSYRQLQDPELPQELYDEQLERGIKRMECLELKSLIIYGLCSGPEYWAKKQHRRRMEALFQHTLGKWGKLELQDDEHLVDW